MLGAPGTGKGTVGHMLSDKLGIVHISSGEIFRSYIKKHDYIGKQIQSYVQQGNLVPDELSFRLVGMRLLEPDTLNGLILDGFPRTDKQAIELDTLLNIIGKKVSVAVNLSLPDEEIISRIVSRRTCPNPDCREIYNLQFKPPKVEGICDKCGSTLILREDDNEETVRQRLDTYHELSEDLINYYKNKDILYTVKMNEQSYNTTDKIAEEIEAYLAKRGEKVNGNN